MPITTYLDFYIRKKSTRNVHCLIATTVAYGLTLLKETATLRPLKQHYQDCVAIK